MEPARIDWKNLEWRFVEDKAYEHINAPMWFDFLNPDDNPIDVENAWFCTPECNHPKTAEDFLKSSSSPCKIPSSLDASKLRRDVKLKRRGVTNSSSVHLISQSRFKEDSENQNPKNLSTPLNYQAKAMKEAIKSSAEKKLPAEGDVLPASDEVLPRLKSALSARNLFAGKDILNQITDFCSELKRLATRTKEREEVENGAMPLVELGKGESERMVKNEECNVEVNGKKRERMPLLDVNKAKSEGRILQEGKRIIKKKVENGENIPVSLKLEGVKRKGGEDLLQIRTNPPSPRCFSAARPPSKITPSKASKSRLENGGLLHEQTNKHATPMDYVKQEEYNVLKKPQSSTTTDPCNKSPEVSGSFSEEIKSYCLNSQVESFIWAVCRSIVPPELLGTPSNWIILRIIISKFIQLRRYEKFSLKQCLHKLKISRFPFLSNKPFFCCLNTKPTKHVDGQGVDIALNDAAHIVKETLLESWIYWLFSSLVVPLLQANFYITQSEHGNQDVYYYRKSVWEKMKNKTILTCMNQNYQYLDDAATRRIIRKRSFGFSKVRIFPKETGVRLLANLRAHSKISKKESG